MAGDGLLLNLHYIEDMSKDERLVTDRQIGSVLVDWGWILALRSAIGQELGTRLAKFLVICTYLL